MDPFEHIRGNVERPQLSVNGSMPRLLNTCCIHRHPHPNEGIETCETSLSPGWKHTKKVNHTYVGWKSACGDVDFPDINAIVPPLFLPWTKQSKQPSPWQRGLAFKKCQKKGSNHISWCFGLEQVEDETPDRSSALANQLRWKNAMLIYHELDIRHKGYIDVEEAAGRLRYIALKAPSLRKYIDRLVTILEDLKPLVSSRGVIEQESALHAIRRFIDDAGLSCRVYGPLRSSSRSLMPEMRRMKSYGPGSLPFYRNGYITKGLSEQLLDEKKWRERNYVPDSDWDVPRCQLSKPACQFPKTPKSVNDIALEPMGEWGPVDAPLCTHALISKLRKERRIDALRREAEAKQKSECTFKPSITASKKRGILKSSLKSEHPKSPDLHDSKETTRRQFVCPEIIKFATCCKDKEECDVCSNKAEVGERQLTRQKKPVNKDACATVTTPEGFNTEKCDADDIQRVWSDPTHFVLHVGEPPPRPAMAWEETLRDHWDEIVHPGEGERHHAGSRDLAVDRDQRQRPRFDAFSRKESDKDRSLKRGLFSDEFGWTPKMAFECEELNAKSEQHAADLLVSCRFERPYQFPSHIYPSTSNISCSPAVRCYRAECRLNEAVRRRLSTSRRHHLSFPLPLHRHKTQIPQAATSIEPLLLPQMPEDEYVKAKNKTMMRSCFGDFATGVLHKNRGYSEWIHHLRGPQTQRTRFSKLPQQKNVGSLLNPRGPVRL